MVSAADAAGATVLQQVFHGFPDRGGVTGMLVLAESHISVHTWPELDYAAFDVFVCGAVDAGVAVDALEQALHPDTWQVTDISRGQRNQASQPSA